MGPPRLAVDGIRVLAACVALALALEAIKAVAPSPSACSTCCTSHPAVSSSYSPRVVIQMNRASGRMVSPVTENSQ